MQLEHESRDGIDIVRLPGRLMMADAPDVRARLKEIITNGSAKLILDLTGTDMLDSSGLAVLVSGLQTARKQGGDIFLIGVNKNVSALFELTRLHTVFQIFDDMETALRATR
jgi:anti-sigma B factor antagonist